MVHNMVMMDDNVAGTKVKTVKPREQWENKSQFLLSCIGFAVGLGNVWRFPYLCYANGGGAFFVPYFLCMLLGGVPLFFLEVGLGQYTGQGGISAWKICPIFKGIGYGTAVICAYLNIYYIIILSWILFYLFSSLTSNLPWTTCNNWWNSAQCSTFDNGTQQKIENITDSVEEFWNNRVLQLSNGIEDIGTVRWELMLTLLLAWIVVYFCVFKGIKITGKVVYFTATFPYVMLTILLIRGLTLPGAFEGIKFYLYPDFSKLKTSQVWIDAGTQIFFSYAVALGCMIALGSYNKFNNNFIRDCILICSWNSGTSVYAGFVIFSVLGFMAHQQNVSVTEVTDKGPGLAFIAYPKAISQMPLSTLWACLFFSMMFILGLDSQFVGVEGFITAVVDIFPNYFRGKKWRREIFVFIVCLLSFMIGLFMITNGGLYVFKIFDFYAASGIVLLLFSWFECIAIGWVYGVNRFYDNITEMIGHRPYPFLKICWKYLSPIVTFVIFLFIIIVFQPLVIETRHRQYIYPVWAQVFGLVLAFSSVIVIPIHIFVSLAHSSGPLKKRLREACQVKLPPRNRKT